MVLLKYFPKFLRLYSLIKSFDCYVTWSDMKYASKFQMKLRFFPWLAIYSIVLADIGSPKPLLFLYFIFCHIFYIQYFYYVYNYNYNFAYIQWLTNVLQHLSQRISINVSCTRYTKWYTTVMIISINRSINLNKA